MINDTYIKLGCIGTKVWGSSRSVVCSIFQDNLFITYSFLKVKHNIQILVLVHIFFLFKVEQQV